jgi:hypothetical protein
MKLTKGIILVAIAAFAFASCKESTDDETPASKTKTELITSGSWVTSDVLINGASIWVLAEACSKDDFMTFKTNGTVITDEGATKCDPADPQTTTANWSFSSDEKKVTIDGDAGDLVTLNETDMVVTMQDSTDVITLKLKKK